MSVSVDLYFPQLPKTSMKGLTAVDNLLKDKM